MTAGAVACRHAGDAAMTERSEILEMLARLQLSGMRVTYDEIVTMSIKRQQGVERVIHALLKAEITAKQARSINYQLGAAKLPLVKELADFSIEDTPVNGELIAQLAGGGFLDNKRNIVLIGGAGTGKSHIAIGIARSIIRAGKKARLFNAVDLANMLEIEAKLDRQGRTADGLMRVNLVINRRARLPPLRAVGRPAAVPPDQPPVRAHVHRRDYQPRLLRMAQGAAA